MTIITPAEFDKKVEIEFAYLTHIERISEEKARQKARQIVSENFKTE